MLVHIKEISKIRTRQIFHNFLVLMFSLLLQVLRYNVYKCTYDVNNSVTLTIYIEVVVVVIVQ
jgi:hypothetical protein